MLSVPREKYPDMNWRAADKVAAWKVFKQRIEVIFVADQIPEERQWALILVAGGDEAYNCWDTLQDTVKDRKVVKQVWDAFEKSFEQSTSFWHFRDAYLADFRQDELETTADLDLRIKQTVRGCQWKKESEEENGHFRKGQHSKSKDAQFRGCQITSREEGHWSETWQRCGCP